MKLIPILQLLGSPASCLHLPLAPCASCLRPRLSLAPCASRLRPRLPPAPSCLCGLPPLALTNRYLVLSRLPPTSPASRLHLCSPSPYLLVILFVIFFRDFAPCLPPASALTIALFACDYARHLVNDLPHDLVPVSVSMMFVFVISFVI